MSVILALNLLNCVLHLNSLPFPLLLAELLLTSEEFLIGLPVAAAKTVPQSSELAVVVVEVEVMHGMAGSTVDNGAVGNVLAIMDHDGPDVDKGKEGNIGEFLKREDEGVDVVRDTLCPAIDRVESMACEGSWHNPLVVGLMKALIEDRAV